jgi:hypothetical protein
VYLWMMRWGNMVLMIKFLDVAKFTTLTPLSLLVDYMPEITISKPKCIWSVKSINV